MTEVTQHVRGQVRAAVAEALKSIPVTGGRVFQARAWPLEEEDMPCWLVHIDGERVETKQTGRQALQTRSVDVSVVALAKHSEAVENELDDLTAAAEETLFASPALSDLTRGFVLTGTENALNADGSIVIGQARLAFTATLPAVEGRPRNRA